MWLIGYNQAGCCQPWLCCPLLPLPQLRDEQGSPAQDNVA